LLEISFPNVRHIDSHEGDKNLFALGPSKTTLNLFTSLFLHLSTLGATLLECHDNLGWKFKNLLAFLNLRLLATYMKDTSNLLCLLTESSLNDDLRYFEFIAIFMIQMYFCYQKFFQSLVEYLTKDHLLKNEAIRGYQIFFFYSKEDEPSLHEGP